MQITLNLASRPYIELQPLYLRLRWAMGLLLVLALPLFLLMRLEERHAAEASSRRLQLNAEIQKLQGERQSFQTQMLLPQNAAVLKESEFLNHVFARKSFSWTAVMMDLETVLPAGVQVTSLEPSILPDGQVSIRMRVNGQRDRAVQLVKNLEHSRSFLQPRLAGETSESQANGGQAVLLPVSATNDVNFDLLAEYNPLSAVGVQDGAPSISDHDHAPSATLPRTRKRKTAQSAGPPSVSSAPSALRRQLGPSRPSVKGVR